jgi:hypothetical protein
MRQHPESKSAYLSARLVQVSSGRIEWAGEQMIPELFCSLPQKSQVI